MTISTEIVIRRNTSNFQSTRLCAHYANPCKLNLPSSEAEESASSFGKTNHLLKATPGRHGVTG
jgi:hypothetical protein